jgi:peptide/nickel transport system permease protein
LRYLGMKLAQSVLLMLGASVLSFAFLQLAPGDFFEEMRLNPQISAETVAGLRAQYGLDRPLPVRYARWLGSAMKGDFGYSFAYGLPVGSLMLVRAKNTLLLTTIATIMTWIIAVPLGMLVADRPNGILAHASKFLESTLLATPELVLALVVLLIGVRTGWFRVGGVRVDATDAPASWGRWQDLASHLAGPVLVLTLGALPVVLRHTTSAMREALKAPFVAAARSYGIRHTRIVFRHALPVALNPLATLFGTSVASLLSASLLVEVVMNWPGLGPLLLEAIMDRDVYVVISAVMLSTAMLTAGTLVSDALLVVFDPRIRKEQMA